MKYVLFVKKKKSGFDKDRSASTSSIVGSTYRIVFPKGDLPWISNLHETSNQGVDPVGQIKDTGKVSTWWVPGVN